ncbi:MAG: hypothetical protein P4L67_02120 [Candidatus Pacebacteria bacterium]|nr:hypothetical protein [Candidatus Paceibacterota bacterium]
MSPKKKESGRLSEPEAIKLVEELRNRLHKELLGVLEFEQQKENEREELLKKATPEEQKRLEKMFGIERAKASEKIIRLSEYPSTRITPVVSMRRR